MSGAEITDAAKFDPENFLAEILSLSVVISLEDEVTFCTSLRALKIKKWKKKFDCVKFNSQAPVAPIFLA